MQQKLSELNMPDILLGMQNVDEIKNSNRFFLYLEIVLDCSLNTTNRYMHTKTYSYILMQRNPAHIFYQLVIKYDITKDRKISQSTSH